MESSIITFTLILLLLLPSSTFLNVGGKVSAWKLLPHLKKRKLKPLSRFVAIASCTLAVIVSFGNGFQSLTALPISGLTEAIWISDDPQTLASHDNLLSPDSVTWNKHMSG